MNPEPPPLKETPLRNNVVLEVFVKVPCMEGETTPTVRIPKVRPAGGAYVALGKLGVTLLEAAEGGLVPTVLEAVTVKV